MFNPSIKVSLIKGFTLLEIMLVLLLLAMASVGVMMSMPHLANSKDSVDWQAQRFATQLQFAQDQALITGQELALVFDENRYRYAFYEPSIKKWLALYSEQFEGDVELPESITLEYTLSGSVWDEIETEDGSDFIDDEYLTEVEVADDDSEEDLSPQVYIMSSGEITPFTVTLSKTEGTTTRIKSIAVNMSGVISYIEAGEQ